MKFISSETCPDIGTSCVEIEYKGKTYIGVAHCHPEDDFSEYTGCRYAHERAEIAAMKEEWKQKKHDCEECRKFIKALVSYKTFDPDSQMAKNMWHQFNCRVKEVNKLAEAISKKMLALDASIKQQTTINNAINQRRLINKEKK